MDLTYTDMYAQFSTDPAVDKCFRELPGHIQAQIKTRKHQPSSYAALMSMVDESETIF